MLFAPIPILRPFSAVVHSYIVSSSPLVSRDCGAIVGHCRLYVLPPHSLLCADSPSNKKKNDDREGLLGENVDVGA